MPDITTTGSTSDHLAPGSVHVDRDRFELGFGQLVVAERDASPSPEEKDAILTSLYEERSRLNRAMRLGQASRNDEEYFADLNLYIDGWEASEPSPLESAGVWAKLEELASSVLAVQAEIARKK